MSLSILKTLNANRKKTAIVLALSAMATNALALGGLDVAETTAEDIKNGVYAIVGICALIYLLYIGVMAFFEKKQWADFAMAVVHVAVVGGSSALGAWAWVTFA